jgi:hypothetical protein
MSKFAWGFISGASTIIILSITLYSIAVYRTKLWLKRMVKEA